jgi:hydrogenase maturation protease
MVAGNTEDSEVLVIGVGNVLLSDEGVGVHAIQALEELKIPDGVELIDGGTASLEILEFIKGRRKVIFIDSVKGGGEPGALYRFHPEDITPQQPVTSSLHQLGLMEMLSLAELSGQSPGEVVIFGVEPARLDLKLELSAEVAAVLPRLVDLVKKELTTG